MFLTAMSSLQSARRKFFMNSTYITCTKGGITCFWAQNVKMSLTAMSSLESANKEIFHELRRTSCLQSRNNLFLGSGCQNESNSHQLSRIGEKKTFHEHDVHHVYKVGITCFWAQDTKMSLTATSSLESARRKFFMNTTYIISTKWESLVHGNVTQNMCINLESNVFVLGIRKWVNGHQLAGIGEKKIFHELDVHHVYKVGITCFWAQECRKWV